MANNTPMPAAVAILRTVSAPANANAPSLLTTLPPELRNKIYEILFTRNEPVMVHDIKTYREENYTARVQRIANGDLRPKRAKVCDEFRGLTALFRTCRQIYHEAVGVLYGSNNFRLCLHVGCSHCLHFQGLKFPADWLSGIGSHLKLLSNVSIEILAPMDNSCGCSAVLNTVNIMPVLRIIWANTMVSGKIEFVSVRSSSNLCAFPKTSADQSKLVQVLNNLLKCLSADTLDIKRYRRFKRLVPAVSIEYSNAVQRTRVFFRKWYKNSGADAIFRNAIILNNGKNVHWEVSQGAQSTLFGLAGDVRNRICQAACSAESEVIVDLETKRLLGMNLNILQLCNATRNAYKSSPRRSPAVLTFMATVDTQVITAKTYHAATEWAIDPVLRVTAVDSTQFIFRHASLESKEVNKIFINTEDLIRLMCYLYADDRTKLLCKTSSDNLVNTSEGSILSVVKLRCAVFVLLCKILEASPEKATEAPPKVLINGEFDRIRTVYSASEEIPELECEYAFTDKSVEELRDLGEVKVRMLRHIASKAERSEEHPHHDLALLFRSDSTPNTLVSMWKDLDDKRWSEWDSSDDEFMFD